MSPLPADEVRTSLRARGDRFTRPGGPLVELHGQLRPDAAGTRLVADARVRALVAIPVAAVLGLVVLVSFSEPVVFVLLAVVVVTAAVASPRLLVVYRAQRRTLIDGLVRELQATELPARERGRPRPGR